MGQLFSERFVVMRNYPMAYARWDESQ